MSRLLQIAACSSCIVVFGATLPAQTYKITGEYKLAAAAHGIAVDGEGRRVLVAADDGVEVLNADNGNRIGIIDGLRSVQDVLLVPAMHGEGPRPSTTGYASDASGHVIAFSLTEMKLTTKITLEAPGATSLCYDVEAGTVEAVSAGGSMTSIDAETHKIVKAGRLSTGTGQIACGNMGHVYVADPAANVVHVLNHNTMQDDGDYPMKSGTGPTGLALDTKGRRLFVGCENGTIEVIDTDAGFTFIELKGGSGAAHETFAWLPQGNGGWKAAAFVAQTDGTLTAIRMNAYINYSIGGRYHLKPGLGAVAFDSQTHHLYIAAMDSGSPVVVVAAY